MLCEQRLVGLRCRAGGPKFQNVVQRGFRDGAAVADVIGVARVLARSLGLSDKDGQDALGVALLEEKGASPAAFAERNEFLRLLMERVSEQWDRPVTSVYSSEDWE